MGNERVMIKVAKKVLRNPAFRNNYLYADEFQPS